MGSILLPRCARASILYCLLTIPNSAKPRDRLIFKLAGQAGRQARTQARIASAKGKGKGKGN